MYLSILGFLFSVLSVAGSILGIFLLIRLSREQHEIVKQISNYQPIEGNATIITVDV